MASTPHGSKKRPDEAKFWFNITTGAVEHGLLSASAKRIGPFETHEEAEQALRLVKERSEAWKKSEQDED